MHKFTILFGLVFLLCGLAAVIFGAFPPGWVIAAEGVVVLAAVIFERSRYKPNVTTLPPGNWVKTAERFVDPESGKPVTVYTDPKTGERIYVAD